MEVTEARAIGEQAGQACLTNAESNGFDSAGAGRFIVRFLQEHKRATGERLVDEAKAAGFIPHTDRAYGPVFSYLARKGLIVRAGFEMRAKGHGAPGASVWAIPR